MVKELRIYHTANQLIVENIPEKDQKQSILPAIVKRKGHPLNVRTEYLK